MPTATAAIATAEAIKATTTTNRCISHLLASDKKPS
jgi:hypothetical protein